MDNEEKVTSPQAEEPVEEAVPDTPETAAEQPEENLEEETRKEKKTAKKEAKQARQEADAAREELVKVQEEFANHKQQYLRVLAEYDNFRKRSAKERENIYTDVRIDTVTKFLPVYDNLQRAMNTQTADEAYKKGVEMTFNQLRQVMTSLGVEEIPAQGETFDPEVHNAVMHVEDAGLGENVIVEEFQKGFKLAGRVIRFSMVKVAN